MNKYKHYLGLVHDNSIITGLAKYYDWSTGKEEWGFELEYRFPNGKKGDYAVNCELFIEKYIA